MHVTKTNKGLTNGTEHCIEDRFRSWWRHAWLCDRILTPCHESAVECLTTYSCIAKRHIIYKPSLLQQNQINCLVILSLKGTYNEVVILSLSGSSNVVHVIILMFERYLQCSSDFEFEGHLQGSSYYEFKWYLQCSSILSLSDTYSVVDLAAPLWPRRTVTWPS